MLGVVDVVDERVEGVNALPEPALDAIPFGRLDDARNDVEGEDPLGPRLVPIDVERDPHLQQEPFGGALAAQQLGIGERLDPLDQEFGRRARPAIGKQQFIKELTGIVAREPHCTCIGCDRRDGRSYPAECRPRAGRTRGRRKDSAERIRKRP
jgi:hypothetical protein